MPKSKSSSKFNLRRNKPDSDSSDTESSDDESDSTYIYESTSSSYNESDDGKKKKKGKSSKKSKNRLRPKQIEESEESEEYEEYEESSIESAESDQDSMEELHKTLHKLFPSKYTKEKMDNHVSSKKSKHKSSKKSHKSKKSEKSKKKHKKSKRREEESEEEEEEESEYETIDEDETDMSEEEQEDESEDESEEDEEEEVEYEDDKNFKITLTIGGNEGGLKNRVASDLSKDEEYTLEDEKTFMRESYEPVGMPLSPSFDNLASSGLNSVPTTPKKQKNTDKKTKEKVSTDIDIEDKYKEIVELKKVLYEKHRTNPKNKIIKKALEQCDHTVKKLIKHARSKNVRNFEELLIETDIPENTDDLGYFKNKLSNKEQLKVMHDLRELNDKIYVEKPYKLTLLQSNLPSNIKAMAMQRLNQLSVMEPGESEYYKLKNWVDSFMRIPFGRYKNITININDGIDKCSDFVVNAKKQLDDCVYGLNDAKMQIMQMVGQWISNPSSLGTAIAVKGPPGTGKTSLIKDGVSKILGREFAFIALGGCGDSSFLEGHSYTYEGSTYGKIVQILMDSKCMNPVIYFDELDKVSDTARGQEIISLLTHLTDTTQNSQFRDKYFSELDFDLSKCLFIFSYNDESLVNPILKDRMYRIQTKGYDLKEKQIIARNYMLPKIREQVGFKEDEVIITDEVLSHIISNQAKGEAGVRNLKRCLEIIHTKLNLYRLVKSGTALFEKEMGLQVSFPYTLTRKDVDILVKNEETINQSVLCSMYA